MAVRYSGDVEVKVTLPTKHSRSSWLRIAFRWPEHGRVKSHVVFIPPRGDRGWRYAKVTPERYDSLVRSELADLLRAKPWLPVERGMFGRPVLRRVFQAPCPR